MAVIQEGIVHGIRDFFDWLIVTSVVDSSDLNGDGKTDLVVADSDNNRIVALLSASINFDLDGDEHVGASDVDALCSDIAQGTGLYDLNGDGTVDTTDMELLLQSGIGTVVGDSDLNGAFGTADLVAVFIAGEYEDEIVGNSTWASGDWNCDGDFDTNDLVFVFTKGSFNPNAAVAVWGRSIGSFDKTGQFDNLTQKRDAVKAVDLHFASVGDATRDANQKKLRRNLHLPQEAGVVNPDGQHLKLRKHDNAAVQQNADAFEWKHLAAKAAVPSVHGSRVDSVLAAD